MKIHELANKNYENVDDIVVDIAESIEEVNALEKERNDLKDENDRLKAEVVNLKEKNLKLLSMMPTAPEVVEEIKEEVPEEIRIEEAYI